ncbi:MAG: isoleucine--tRNA ligase [Gammaproteobacteria bacterium]|nr:isoleucine--tRNA ligase [Gammaproteobacteria bacterium]
MTEYKDTINLPKTAFPMKANLANREPKMLQQWQERQLYPKLREIAKGRPRFLLLDGPPYANGPIHIGHALNKILKDIIVKCRTLDGYDAPYIPAWDCHGLPIELQVEKKKGRVGQKIDARAFRQACRDYAQKQIDGQQKDFIRLGIMGDWENPSYTMHASYEAAQLRGFAKILANGHVYKGYKPVHWCLDCRSALAEAEVEYQDKTSPGIDVRFAAVDASAINALCGVSDDVAVDIPIWTTTPWTLPANQAVAVHPELDYVLVESGSGEARLLLAAGLLESAMQRYSVENYKVIGRCIGADLRGQLLQHPFYQRQVPVIAGDYVTLEAGTGAVHTAPGHGQEDFAAGVENDLPLENPVGANGCFIPGTPLVEGQHVLAANDFIIELLKENGALLCLQPVAHSYPHCWRHKSPLIFRATPQWFIGMDQAGLRQQALAEITTVDWIPDWGEARIEGMVVGRPDWCISRQRTWGVPIPLFIHKDTDELHPDTQALIAKVAGLVEKDGIEAWFELDVRELLGDDAADYVQVRDIVDVWMDSGMMHHCLVGTRPETKPPAELYLEGSDQHRGWFQSSLLTSVAMTGKAPYKQVLTHGFTVDENGRKMSKSLGNTIAPQEVVNVMGADVLRLWVAATDYRGEISVSDEILKRAADSYRRIRNTFRFLLGNLDGFDPATDMLPVDQWLALDRWALDRAIALQEEVVQAYHDYEFHLIHQKVHNFCAKDMGGFYLDIIKDRLYTTPRDGRARRSAQCLMFHIAEAMVRWLAPIISFTAEEIWENLPGPHAESVFFSTWYEWPKLPAKDAGLDWDRLIAVSDAVDRELERLRDERVIGSSLAAKVDLYCDEELRLVLTQLGEELRFLLLTSEARVHELSAAPGGAKEASSGLLLVVGACEHDKCVRCWHRRPEVGSNPEHPEICDRCVGNISGSPENRQYV